MFSSEPRCHYGTNQITEVICQLRFPEILSISTTVPDLFQDSIRDNFPQFFQRQETPVPKIIGSAGHFSLDQQKPTTNYHFTSADNVWRINLTSKFISLTCTNYTSWEAFAGNLDKPLASFIQIYKPAYFERIGLRYINAFSRNALGLENTTFTQMIHPCYLGPMAEEDVKETTVTRCTLDLEMAIRGGCRVKLHSGPGLVKRPGSDDKEVKFIFDQDLYMPGQIPVNLSAGALETLHSQAFSIFRGAITDTLHAAMDPE